MDEITKEFLQELDKLASKYHRAIQPILKFDPVKGLYPAVQIKEVLPKEEPNTTPPSQNPFPESPTQGVNPQEFENPKGQVVETEREVDV